VTIPISTMIDRMSEGRLTLACEEVKIGAHGARAGSAAAGVAATTSAEVKSPGVISASVIEAPVQIPSNACGNTITVVGLLNPAAGNTCISR
jgi:hypothetical protein